LLWNPIVPKNDYTKLISLLQRRRNSPAFR
jgi:hypothetical protein